jgi:hypothetical protein
MKTFRRLILVPGAWALLLLLSASAALADPPSRVIRLKYMSGEVSMQPGGVNDWVPAVLNRPLTTADRVWTDKNSRAEMGLGSASLRVNAETSMTLTNVSDNIVQVELDQGTLNLHIRHLFDGETYEIDTPNLAFTVLKGGDYRFDVDPNADTTYVTVWKGEGEANGQNNGVRLRSGEQASFLNGTSLQHETYAAPDRDGFDDWCRVRDDREDHAESYRYVSADVIGADDLDDYGTWRVVGAYGPVWVPRVAPGWAPYRYGHWAWIDPWGWTWVDDAPWGFAPAHYGRWVFYNGFWAWAPGPIMVARPVYAPALVAWVGGPHWGVSVSVGGGVGWFPLGWGEPYVPAYHVSRTYFEQVNVTNTRITNITRITNTYYVNNTTVVNQNVTRIHYVNQTVPGAMTAVPNRAFTNSEPVSRSLIAVNGKQVHQATLIGSPPVAPGRNSVLGVNAGTRAALPPMRTVPRTVVSHAAPPPRPIPFEAKQGALARNPGRPLDSETEAQIRSTERNTPMRGPASPRSPAQPARPGLPAMAEPGSRPSAPSGTNVRVAEPRMPERTVPRPPEPMTGNGNPRNETVRPEMTNPHAQPVATPAPARNVPHPPETGNQAGSRPVEPRQPVQFGDPEGGRPNGGSQPIATPKPSNPGQLERTAPAPRAPENASPAPRQPARFGDPEGGRPNGGSQPIATPKPSNPGQLERTAPAPRAPENASPAPRQPARIDNVRMQSEPRANVEPRPQQPRPMYDTRAAHDEQRPQSRSQAPAQTKHESNRQERKETH